MNLKVLSPKARVADVLMRVPNWAVAVFVVLAALVSLAMTGRKSVHAERVIPHPAEAIWTVLTETDG